MVSKSRVCLVVLLALLSTAGLQLVNCEDGDTKAEPTTTNTPTTNGETLEAEDVSTAASHINYPWDSIGVAGHIQ